MGKRPLHTSPVGDSSKLDGKHDVCSGHTFYYHEGLSWRGAHKPRGIDACPAF